MYRPLSRKPIKGYTETESLTSTVREYVDNVFEERPRTPKQRRYFGTRPEFEEVWKVLELPTERIVDEDILTRVKKEKVVVVVGIKEDPYAVLPFQQVWGSGAVDRGFRVETRKLADRYNKDEFQALIAIRRKPEK